MPIGSSARIVIYLDDPSLKHRLHSALAARQTTLKAWFVDQAEAFLRDVHQARLPFAGAGTEDTPPSAGGTRAES